MKGKRSEQKKEMDLLFFTPIGEKKEQEPQEEFPTAISPNRVRVSKPPPSIHVFLFHFLDQHSMPWRVQEACFVFQNAHDVGPLELLCFPIRTSFGKQVPMFFFHSQWPSTSNFGVHR